jgi:ATP-dependent DNA helicase RecG
MPEPIDWSRLQKALAVEAQYGFTDLVGQRYRFSEFFGITLRQPPPALSSADRQQWRDLAAEFDGYTQLMTADRKILLTKTERLLVAAREQIAELVRDPAARNPVSAVKQAPAHFHETPAATSPPPADLVPTGLDRPIKDLPKVGSKFAESLAKLGLYQVKDLLFYYPRDYIDYARQVDIRSLAEGETVTLVGTVKRCSCFSSAKNQKLTILEMVLSDPTGQIKLGRFYAGSRYSSRGWQESIKKKFAVGSIVAASGLVKSQGKYGLTLDNPEMEVLADSSTEIDSMRVGRILPVYPLTEGIGADALRRAMVAALPSAALLSETLPEQLRQQFNLAELAQSIADIHFPADVAAKDAARRRLVFDEFFYLQLGFLYRRQQMRQRTTVSVKIPENSLLDRLRQMLPFQLTGAQERVVGEILQDLQGTHPMNRMVQGDVGSGKTLVAVMAILAAIQSNYQTALMAPTEVLAEQHYRKLSSWFTMLHLPIELLTGSTKAAKRKQIYRELETGELSIIVGTHALIQDKVNFDRLGLVVIDEQHRFGVYQRAMLQQKGLEPHVLTMTATPIPRTLALTLHGDLDVSQIDELPAGRQPIQTNLMGGRERRHAYELMKREIAQGQQVYIVLPLIEESEKLDLRSAIAEHERLSTAIFPEFQVGLLHGKMSSAEKDGAIEAFRRNETQILVATTVIEVGVDVPNATVMMIENAERFGLSQLHQLRGRVGRGSHQSFCLLMSGSNSADAKQRLQVLVDSQDGFWISEMDLRLRGPGEVLGARQSGLGDFALASLVADGEVLQEARTAADQVMAGDSLGDGKAEQDLAAFPHMRAELDYRYQKLMGGSIFT